MLCASGQVGAVVAAALAARLVAADDTVVREKTARAPGRGRPRSRHLSRPRSHHLLGGGWLSRIGRIGRLIGGFLVSAGPRVKRVERVAEARAIVLGERLLHRQRTFSDGSSSEHGRCGSGPVGCNRRLQAANCRARGSGSLIMRARRFRGRSRGRR
eukprot:scaffold53647_cov43-Phaeocystis_antarctica.AAC.2